MPSETENQRKLFCIALSIKIGETKPEYSKQAAKMASEMSIEKLTEYCGSPSKEKSKK